MIPRRDPETRPSAVAVQLINRGQPDIYGAERGYRGHARAARIRPIETRNGLPVGRYRYRGTGECMTEVAAAAVLTTTSAAAIRYQKG